MKLVRTVKTTEVKTDVGLQSVGHNVSAKSIDYRSSTTA